MGENEFVQLIRSLQSKRPLRVVYLSNKELGSLQWRDLNQPWEHLMSVPRRQINKFRSPDYLSSRGVQHRSLYSIYKKLVSLGLISPQEKSKFLS